MTENCCVCLTLCAAFCKLLALVPRRLHNLIAAVLLIFSIGGHWTLLQSGAWIGMFISFSQSDSVAEAVAKTFDGNHPCKMCKFVTEGKKAEKKHEHQLSKLKIDFFLTQSDFVLWNPAFREERIRLALVGSEQSYSPPTPPPRSS